MLRDIGITCARRDLSQQQAVLERSDSNADDIDAFPGAPGRSLGPPRTSIGRWFSRSVNALGQPYANAEADRWFDWPRFPPF